MRDWKAHPAIVQLQGWQEIEEVADLHGDYEKTVGLLVGAGVMSSAPAKPQDAQWVAGKRVLVCTGDMIDKWNHGLEVVRLIRALQASAEKSGGHFVVTLGNHEAEFIAAGGANKKAAEFEGELQSNGINPVEVAAGRDAEGIGAWMRNLPAAAKVDDWFFCHAGNTFGMSLSDLESAIEKGVNKDGFGAFVLAEPNSILEARIQPVPWWILVAPAAPSPQASSDATSNDASLAVARPVEAKPIDASKPAAGPERLRQYLAALGCKHLAIGHTPGKVHVAVNVDRPAGQPFTYEGLLFLCDTGMSQGAQDGRGIVLRIHRGEKETVDTVDASGAITPLWAEK